MFLLKDPSTPRSKPLLRSTLEEDDLNEHLGLGPVQVRHHVGDVGQGFFIRDHDQVVRLRINRDDGVADVAIAGILAAGAGPGTRAATAAKAPKPPKPPKAAGAGLAWS